MSAVAGWEIFYVIVGSCVYCSGSLARINPVNGEETVIGQTGLGFNAFDLGEVGGKLYLTDFSNNVYAVDPETGIATAIGATGMPPETVKFVALETESCVPSLC